MDRIAFVFSGQGDQYSGMGKSLYDLGGSAKKLYDEAEKYRPGTINQSFYGANEELQKTSNTQPCLYLVDMVAALSLKDKGIKAHGAAGFSLGELAALAFSGAYSYEDGFKLVTKRGQLMDGAAACEDTAMCAVLKLDRETVINTAAAFHRLYAVNFNCPGQIVVSGLKSSINEFADKVKELGGRCIPLSVSAAFHSPFMNDAAAKLGEELASYSIKATDIPVYSNLTAAPYTDDVSNSLEMQMRSPVKWQETIENMISDGFTRFVEVGPGKTLCGFIKKISKDVQVFSVQDAETLEETVRRLKEHA